MTDRELLDYIKSDSRKGMELLIESYSALVYKIVSSVILPVGSYEDAEECVSDTFIAFYNYIDKIDLQKATLKGFVAMIAKRNAISFYRTLKRNALVSGSFDEMPDLPQNENTLDTDTKQALANAIKALGEPDSTIVTRRYILGETAKEISAVVGLSSEAVQKRLERSLPKLREMLGGVIYG